MKMAPHRLRDLENEFRSRIAVARIPGGAFGITIGGEIAGIGAAGVRDLETLAPVSADTLFPIASTVKAMNAVLLGTLVDDGTLDWDAPISSYIPHFRLATPSSDDVSLRDLLCMRTGLPAHDFVWMENPITRGDLARVASRLPPNEGFREKFQYNNLTYALAGFVAEAQTGQTWENLLQRRVLDPLGMSSTTFAPPIAADITKFYHETSARKLVRSRSADAPLIAPAGGTGYSNIRDMASWLVLNTIGMTPSGETIVSARTLETIRSPCMPCGDDPTAPSVGAAYALGWFVDTYRGEKRVTHTGWLNDVQSCVSLFPERQIGIVSFANFASCRPCLHLNDLLLDLLLERAPTDALDQAAKRYESKISATRARNANVVRSRKPPTARIVDERVGRYVHPAYGSLHIEHQQGGLGLRRGALRLPLVHSYEEAWIAPQTDLWEIHVPQIFDPCNPLVFRTGDDGAVEGLVFQAEPKLAPAFFSKAMPA